MKSDCEERKNKINQVTVTNLSQQLPFGVAIAAQSHHRLNQNFNAPVPGATSTTLSSGGVKIEEVVVLHPPNMHSTPISQTKDSEKKSSAKKANQFQFHCQV